MQFNSGNTDTTISLTVDINVGCVYIGGTSSLARTANAAVCHVIQFVNAARDSSSLVAVMGVLPIELIERIIDFVGDSNDTRTLNSCALTSRQLLPVTRRNKYSSVAITCCTDIIPLERFWCQLQTFPWVVDYVESLYFFDNDPYWNAEAPNRPHVSPWKIVNSGDDGTPTGGDVPSVLSKLTRIKSLRLRAHRVRSYSIFSGPLKEALMATFRLPTLQIVDLDGLTDLPATLFSSPSIKALYVKGCTIYTSPINEVVSERCPSQAYLEDLMITDVLWPYETFKSITDFLFHPGCTLNLTKLKKVSVQAKDGSEIISLMKIVNQCERSLESLDFEASRYADSHSFAQLSLAGLTNLKHLTLKTIIYADHIPRLSAEDRLLPGPIISIISILSSLPGLSLLLPHTSSSTQREKPVCRLESLTLGLVNNVQSVRIPPIRPTTLPEEAESIHLRTRAWEHLDDLLVSMIAANQHRDLETGASKYIKTGYRNRSRKGVEPIVKIYCIKEIGVKNLRRTLRESYKTGRVQIVVVPSGEQ
ncbi:hypothetical protein AX16_010733 [Volvariella volvacea WC 439]|nr:hypothetical protein AX16_010733 [Volvariella volvacea WC 439]